MTVMAERTAAMSAEEFEQIARFTANQFEGIRLEFIGGRIWIKGVTDGNHGTIIMWLIRQCMQARPDLDLNPVQGLRTEAYRNGRARPDGVLAPTGHFEGHGDWADPSGVLMAVEVTSYDSDTHARDRVEKPVAYAEAEIPVYLLIDRDNGTVTVFSEPDNERSRYRNIHTIGFGEQLVLPPPVGITLDTDILKRYAQH
ncbi:Uma2 family endonuclease [Streptomyces sp. NPDC059063]|uniref:Uma2 family endonuclease n=1 Tax=unclassified Streptomyces TaxID=2593676 RepID=UPI0036BC0513